MRKSIIVASIAIMLVVVVVIAAYYYISNNPNSTAPPALLTGGGPGNSYLSKSESQSFAGFNGSYKMELCTPGYYQNSEICNAIATEFGINLNSTNDTFWNVNYPSPNIAVIEVTIKGNDSATLYNNFLLRATNRKTFGLRPVYNITLLDKNVNFTENGAEYSNFTYGYVYTSPSNSVVNGSLNFLYIFKNNEFSAVTLIGYNNTVFKNNKALISDVSNDMP
jgi:hypothetical protein